MYLDASTAGSKETEDEFARSANSLADEEKVSAFHQNMNHRGVPEP